MKHVSVQEVLETVGRKVEILHEAEKPYSRVADSLLETIHGRALLVIVNLVSQESAMCELLLLLCKPSRCQGGVREERVREQSDDTGSGTCNVESGQMRPPGPFESRADKPWMMKSCTKIFRQLAFRSASC